MVENENVGSLQEMINANATAKLNKDLDKLTEVLSCQSLLSGNNNWKPLFAIEGSPLNDNNSPKFDTIDRLMNKSWGTLRDILFKRNIEDYIQTETEELFQKIEKLREDVDHLDYLRHNSED